jgi:hypothetical protein
MQQSVLTRPGNETSRIPHFLYIDEFPPYICKATEDIFTIYRKYRVGTIISAQNLSQFGSDEDGFVTIGEMSTLLQQPGQKIFRELVSLFSSKFFINCTFERRGQPAVIIHNAIPGEDVNSGVGFIVCQCPNCGTANRIRAGSMGKCVACQAPISGVVK